MGARGPAPTPDNILELRGSNRAGRRGAEPPKLKGSTGAPKWLHEKARPLYRELVRFTQGMGIFSACDRLVLARYAQLFTRWLQVEDFLNEHGQTFVIRGRGKKDKDGNAVEGPILSVQTFPQVRIARGLADELLRMEDRIGLSPSARARLAGFVGDGSGAQGAGDESKAGYFAAG